MAGPLSPGQKPCDPRWCFSRNFSLMPARIDHCITQPFYLCTCIYSRLFKEEFNALYCSFKIQALHQPKDHGIIVISIHEEVESLWHITWLQFSIGIDLVIDFKKREVSGAPVRDNTGQNLPAVKASAVLPSVICCFPSWHLMHPKHSCPRSRAPGERPPARAGTLLQIPLPST